MRIFEVTDFYPPPMAGGRELRVQMLSAEFMRRGHQVDVLTLAGPKGARVEYDGDIQVHRLAGWSQVLVPHYANPETPFHPTLPDPGLVRVISNLIEERRPDVVHVHSWLLYSLLPLLPTRDTKLVVWMHDYSLVCPRTTYYYRGTEVCSGPRYAKCISCSSGQYGLAKAAALTTGLSAMKPWRNKVDRYTAVSQFTADASASLVARDSGTIEVIPNFVPEAAFQAVGKPRPSFVPAEGDYLMYAGALTPHKGLNVLLDAWAGLRNRPPLVLAGIRRPDTPTSFPPDVTVVEDVPFHDVLAGFANCLASVVPSIWPDPCPSVALEAMAAGRPVVASAIGGLTDIVVDGDTGIHVPPGDVPALREALEQLIDDPVGRERMGTAGRVRAQNYSLDVVADRWERLFHDLVETART